MAPQWHSSSRSSAPEPAATAPAHSTSTQHLLALRAPSQEEMEPMRCHTRTSTGLCQPWPRAPAPGEPVAHTGTPWGAGAERGHAWLLSCAAPGPAQRDSRSSSIDTPQLTVATAQALCCIPSLCEPSPLTRFSKANEVQVDPKWHHSLTPPHSAPTPAPHRGPCLECQSCASSQARDCDLEFRNVLNLSISH